MNVETIERFLSSRWISCRVHASRPGSPSSRSGMTNDRLRALVRLESDRTDLNPSVLFLCVHNAGRSQMAAGWMRHLAGDRGRCVLRRLGPAAALNEAAVAAMAEKGIDISRELPQPWADEIVRAADVIVTMGCGDACPVYPGKRYVDWELDDPAGKPVEEVRPIRDEIERRVRGTPRRIDRRPASLTHLPTDDPAGDRRWERRRHRGRTRRPPAWTPTLEITMIVADGYLNYSICGLPFFVSGEVEDWRAAGPSHGRGGHGTRHRRVLRDQRARSIDVARRAGRDRRERPGWQVGPVRPARSSPPAPGPSDHRSVASTIQTSTSSTRWMTGSAPERLDERRPRGRDGHRQWIHRGRDGGCPDPAGHRGHPRRSSAVRPPDDRPVHSVRSSPPNWSATA